MEYCYYCNREIKDDQGFELLGGKVVHPECAELLADKLDLVKVSDFAEARP